VPAQEYLAIQMKNPNAVEIETGRFTKLYTLKKRAYGRFVTGYLTKFAYTVTGKKKNVLTIFRSQLFCPGFISYCRKIQNI